MFNIGYIDCLNVPSPTDASKPVPISVPSPTDGPFVPPTIISPFPVNFASAPIASVPLSCEINTALSASDVTPEPPSDTGSAPSIAD